MALAFRELVSDRGDHVSSVGIGMLLHNNEKYLRQAFDSLLAQTFEDFTLYVSDDASKDGTWSIVLEYAARDKRVVPTRKTSREGMIANYRSTFLAARPGTEYWAWASDHDVHHQDWLERMVAALDAHPKAVVAHPVAARIDADGRPIDIPPTVFSTDGLPPLRRVIATARLQYGFGNMIYGLFRYEAVRNAGIFRRLLMPDAVLLLELSTYGSVVQVHETLWFRRFNIPFDLERQRRNIFAQAPWWTRIPWLVQHVLSLTWNTVLSPSSSVPCRAMGVPLVLTYTWARTTPSLRRLAARIPGARSAYRRMRRSRQLSP